MRPCHTRESGAVEDVHSTRWATLLALEPTSETASVEDVATGKLLAARGHLFTTDGTEMGLLELLFGGIRAAGRREREKKRGKGDHIKASYFDHSIAPHPSSILIDTFYNQHVHVHRLVALFSSPFTTFQSWILHHSQCIEVSDSQTRIDKIC